MSLVPERWQLLGRASDDEGRPVAYVGREKLDDRGRLTVWKLIQRKGHWFNCGQWISLGRFRITDDYSSARTRPLRLSDSRIDTLLRSYADGHN